jgi:hypothetical protein
MRSTLKRCAFLAVAAILASCEVEVSQSHVNRIVKTTLNTRRSSPSYRLDIQVWKKGGEDRRVVNCIIEKDGANTFSYAFRDGMRYWSTPDGCVILYPNGARAEVFSGLPEPTEEELRAALRWGAIRYISRHTIIAHFFEREGKWKGIRVITTPKHPGPLDLESEKFVEKRSNARVFGMTYDEHGKLLRRRLARSVRVMKPDEFAVPEVPDFGVTRFAPGSKSTPAPEWAREPTHVLEILAGARPRHSEGLAVYDMSKGGFVFVLFERETSEPLVTSPLTHVADVGGVEVSVWPVGGKFMYRWRDGGIEFSLLGNVPPDVAWDFLVANLPAGKPLAASTSSRVEGAEEERPN